MSHMKGKQFALEFELYIINDADLCEVNDLIEEM